MVGPIKTRLACDRCHGQKLRCPKQSGSRVCTRCERAGVACIFSPIGKTSGAFQNGSSNGMSPIDTGFPAAELFGGTSDGVNLNNDDWSRPCASGNAGSNGSNGTPGLNFDELIQMASIDAPIFTSDTANLFAGMSPEMTSGMTPETTAPTAVNSANLASSTATPKDTTNTATSTTLTHRLAKLVVDTDLLYEALPNESTMHVPLEAGSSDGCERNGESDGATPDGDAQVPFLAFLDRPHYSQDKFAKKEFLERVFDITQRLSTAYADADAAPKKTKNAANGTRNGREAEEACDADNCLHTVDLPGNLSSLEAAFLESGVSAKKPRSTGNDIDLTVVSLLVAAHTRLLDVLVRIVHGIFACYRLRVATSTLDDAEMQLPDLMIGGSFVPPKGSAALVHAFLLRHLLDSLQTGVELYWAKLKEVDDSESSEKSLANRERHIAALQFGVLKERHDATLHHLVAVGTDLASTGLIK